MTTLHCCFGRGWTCLKHSGQNGFILYIVCVRFWGIQKSGEEWELSVEGVHWALSCVLKGLDHSG